MGFEPKLFCIPFIHLSRGALLKGRYRRNPFPQPKGMPCCAVGKRRGQRGISLLHTPCPTSSLVLASVRESLELGENVASNCHHSWQSFRNRGPEICPSHQQPVNPVPEPLVGFKTLSYISRIHVAGYPKFLFHCLPHLTKTMCSSYSWTSHLYLHMLLSPPGNSFPHPFGQPNPFSSWTNLSSALGPHT